MKALVIFTEDEPKPLTKDERLEARRFFASETGKRLLAFLHSKRYIPIGEKDGSSNNDFQAGRARGSHDILEVINNALKD